MKFLFGFVRLFAAPAGCLLLAWSCTNDKYAEPQPAEIACDSVQVSFNSQIRPIVESRCALTGCHVSGFSHGDYTSFQNFKVKADNGQLRKQVIDRKVMPPGDPLPQEELRLLNCWLRQGAPQN